MANAFDLDAFIAFVAGKPADQAYPWCISSRCALAQFGYRGAVTEEDDVVRDHLGREVPDEVYAAALTEITFGALHQRLLALSHQDQNHD